MANRRKRREHGGWGGPGWVSLVAALTLAAGAPAASALPSGSDAGDWVADGTVFAIAHGAGHTYIGGDFTHVGPRSGVGAPLGTADGLPHGAWPEVAGGQIYAVAADTHGGWYIGGDFTAVGGTARNGLAHITAAGAVDGFDPQPDGPVRAIAVGTRAPDAGVVYIGGDFLKLHGQNRSHAAAIEANGTVTTWNPGPDQPVLALAEAYVPQQQSVADPATDQPVVFVGGSLTTLGTTSQTAVGLGAVWGAHSTAPTGNTTNTPEKGESIAWSPGLSNGATVRAIALGPVVANADHSKVSLAVYYGGDSLLKATGFQIATAPTGTAPPVRSTPSALTYTTWNAAPTCTASPACDVDALALTSTGVYAGGDFDQLGGATAPAPNLSVVTPIDDPAAGGTSSVGTWSPAPNATVRALAVGGDGTVYAAGDFTQLGKDAGATARTALAAIDPTSGLVKGWDARAAGGTGGALAIAGTTLYAGGSFTTVGAQPAAGLAALDANGALDPAFAGNSTDGPVHALALSPDSSTLYVGGGFTRVGTAPRNHLAAIGTADATVRAWDPDLDGWVLSLATIDDVVYAGGSFTHVRGGAVARDRIAAFDAASGGPTAFDPGANDLVRAIDPVCGTVYVGGSFTHVGGADRARIAALDPTTGNATAWDPDARSVVYALADDAGTVFAGGGFTFIGGAPRYGIARISKATGKATAWNPVAESPPIVRGIALSPDGATLYAAGSFVRIGGEDRNRLGALSTATGAATAWNPFADAPAYAILTSGTAVYAGGAFRAGGDVIAQSTQQGFASFDAAGASAGPPVPTPCPGSAPPAAPPETPTATPSPVTTSSAPPLKPLRILAFRVKPRRFHVAYGAAVRKKGTPAGTAFVFALTRSATVRIAIDRELFGRRRGKDCVAPLRRRGRGCTRYQLYGTLTRTAREGRNRLAFSGRFGKLGLPTGIYTAKLTAIDAQGKPSRSRLARFEVMSS